MSYDLYSALAINRMDAINCATELERLTVESASGRKQDALEIYLKLVHSKDPNQPSRYSQELIRPELDQLQRLGLRKPTLPVMEILPGGSAFLQFDFTLAAPFFTKDDTPLYVTEAVNPVRKEKVFRVPMMAASSWKGLLRWTLMQISLVERNDSLSADEFARERFRMALIFGDEKGEGSDKAEDVAGFLDNLKPDAEKRFRELVKTYFGLSPEEGMPHFSGRLMCYPTFFDRIDIEVINPHRRETKAGTQPIYLECVPIGGQGTFSLLYVPFDRVGRDEGETQRQAAADLPVLAEGLQAMFTLYGFGAKTSSGFGLAKENLVGEGHFVMNIADRIPQATEESRPDSGAAEQMQANIADFIQRFGLDEFPHWTNEELGKSGWGNKRQSDYKRLRLRHPDWDADADIWREPEQGTVADKAEVPAPLTSRTFASFAVLPAIIASLAWPKEQTR